jgi:uncharacterized metal-binding protein YceD (DUF177 family)
MKPKSNLPALEFSRPIAIERIAAAGFEEAITANDVERRRLAERFGILELPMLKALLEVRRDSAAHCFTVIGRLFADVVQQCVVTLDALPSHIEQDINAVFAPEADDQGEDVLLDSGEIDPIHNGIIDLGELVAQNLGVALDPYPRKAGVDFGHMEFGDKGPAAGPMAILAGWKEAKK